MRMFFPQGMHKHFRMLNIHRDFNANSPVKLTIPELWERLSQYFALDLLDDMVKIYLGTRLKIFRSNLLTCFLFHTRSMSTRTRTMKPIR